MRRKVLKLFASFIVAAIIIGLFAVAVGLEDIGAAILQIDPFLALLGGIFSFGGIALLGVAWWYVVREVAGFDFWEGIRVFFATMFANFITPLGQFGGEPFIAYILSKDTDLPIEKSMGAVVTADILNSIQFFTISLGGILLFFFFFEADPFVSTILKVVVGLVIALIVSFAYVWTNEEHVLWLATKLGVGMRKILLALHIKTDFARKLTREKIRRKGKKFYETMKGLFDHREKIFNMLAISHLGGLFGVFGMYLFLLALGAELPLSIVLFVLPVSMLAGYLPLPGGLGGIEAALALLLTLVGGVTTSVALLGSLLYRLFTYWLVLLIGGVIASRLSVDILAQILTNED